MSVEVKDDFIDQIADSVKKTHYYHRDARMKDILSVQSDLYQKILSKPERYSLFNDHVFDCVFFQKQSLEVDRILIARDMEEINNNGWLYQELALIAESLGLSVDIVSITTQGFTDYREHIRKGEILNCSGHGNEISLPMPKVLVDTTYFEQYSDLNRHFQRTKLCPNCAKELKKMVSNKSTLINKYFFICPDKKCGFKVSAPKLGV